MTRRSKTFASTAVNPRRLIRFISRSSAISMATVEAFLGELVAARGDRFAHDFFLLRGIHRQRTDLVAWMTEHATLLAIANYVNWRGRTVRAHSRRGGLREALEGHLREPRVALSRDFRRERFTRSCSSSFKRRKPRDALRLSAGERHSGRLVDQESRCI